MKKFKVLLRQIRPPRLRKLKARGIEQLISQFERQIHLAPF